jgi:hypothetical protein
MINNLPLPTIETSVKTKIISLVDDLINSKTENTENDTTKEEEELNNLILNLYGLSNEERGLINNS